MKKLVTKLRKGPVPNPATREKPDSPESMGSLFAEAGEDYLSNEDKEEEEEKKTPSGSQPAITPQNVTGNALKPKRPRIKV